MKPASPQAATAAPDASKSLNEQAGPASKPAKEASRGYRDAELVQRAKDGDPAAFRKLFDQYHRRAFAVAVGVVKNQEDALDVVQEAFIKVHRHIDRFQGSSSFYTWLYRIVMNLAIDHVRKARHVTDFDDRIRHSDAAGDGALMPRIMDENPGKTVVRSELTAHIQQALDQLPEYHRAVILLREVEGLSYEEMAKVLDVPKGTIMSRLFHARKKMQELLKAYIDGDFEIGD
jgi:RNA polymerase sigma-70 factor (ECF subfamily)